jgi:acetyl-CoA acyltransferase
MAPRKKKTARRAVIVGGVRTPFVRSFGDLMRTDTIGLGVAAVKGLLARYPVPGDEIDSMVWGGVVLPSATVNIGREILLDLDLPRTIECTTMTRACTTSLYTAAMASAAIERGDADVVIAGGSDSLSNAELTMPRSLMHKVAPVALSRKSGPMDYAKLAGKLNVKRDLLPKRPEVKERSTGELMGESAEKMARRNEISREDQDALALRSHQRAAAAIESGRFADEIVAVDGERGDRVFADDLVRGDTSAEKLGKLRPAFAKEGTLTAGNSSALTDGGAALLLMTEEKARALGYDDLVALKSWSFDAVDPADQMLIGPAISMPRSLDKAGMTLADADLVDIHEAFAAQVLCVLKMLGNDRFAREVAGLKKALGTVAAEDINVHGGSIALGHPFAATGARMITTMANELRSTGKGTAVLGICGAGGVSAGAVLERI